MLKVLYYLRKKSKFRKKWNELNINHKKLIKQLRRFKSIDKKTLSLIKCMLKVENLLQNKKIIQSEKETP